MSRLVRRTYPGLDPRQRKAGLLSGGLVQHRRGRDRGTAKRRAAAVAGDGRPAAGPLGLPPSAEPADPHHPALNDPGTKGITSSTADIAATAVATAHHLGHLLDEPTLARLCVALEPTDSTLFRQLTLFDHNTAATQIACPPPPALDLLVLESPLTLRTTDYHQLPREPGLLANASRLQLAWEKVQQACHCGSPQLLGEAATISAIASQQLLPKPGFDALLDLVESAGLYGLNVAHSGSVVGLLLDRRRHDVEFLQWRLADSDIAAHWPQQHLLAMVPGGVILQ